MQLQEIDEKPVSPCRALVPVMDDEKPIPLKDDVKPIPLKDDVKATPLKDGAKPGTLMENVDSSFPELPDVFAKICVGGNSSEPTKTIPAASKAKKIIKQVQKKKGKKHATKAKKNNGAGAKPAKDVEVISSGDERLGHPRISHGFHAGGGCGEEGCFEAQSPSQAQSQAQSQGEGERYETSNAEEECFQEKRCEQFGACV